MEYGTHEPVGPRDRSGRSRRREMGRSGEPGAPGSTGPPSRNHDLGYPLLVWQRRGFSPLRLGAVVGAMLLLVTCGGASQPGERGPPQRSQPASQAASGPTTRLWLDAPIPTDELAPDGRRCTQTRRWTKEEIEAAGLYANQDIVIGTPGDDVICWCSPSRLLVLSPRQDLRPWFSAIHGPPGRSPFRRRSEETIAPSLCPGRCGPAPRLSRPARPEGGRGAGRGNA